MVKHTQTIRRLLATNCLSVFDHFVGLALKAEPIHFHLKWKSLITVLIWLVILE